MNELTYTGIIIRFVRGLLLTDIVVAGIVAIISSLLDLHTWFAYGTLIRWSGMALIVLAGILTVGGLSSRLQDVGAYNLSHAGDMSENLYHVAESGRNSIGCSLLLFLAGLSLIAIGNFFQTISTLFG